MKSSASVNGESCPEECSSICRSERPNAVEPGSRTSTTDRFRARNHLASFFAWLDLPEPSGPSSVMKNPFFSDMRQATSDKQHGESSLWDYFRPHTSIPNDKSLFV